MSDYQESGTLTCPTCEVPVPASARFCPNCGTRLRAGADYGPTAPFTTARIGHHVEDEDRREDRNATSVGADDEPDGWTASTAHWDRPGSIARPTEPQRNRTLWIILGIVAFIILCCCVLLFLTVIVSANDTAFQEEISALAGRMG